MGCLAVSSGRRGFRPEMCRKSVTLSVGIPLCPYPIAYRRDYGLSFKWTVLTKRSKSAVSTRECKNPYPKCGFLNRNVSKHYLYQDKVIPTSCLACSGLEWLQRQGKMLTCQNYNVGSCNLEWVEGVCVLIQRGSLSPGDPKSTDPSQSTDPKSRP